MWKLAWQNYATLHQIVNLTIFSRVPNRNIRGTHKNFLPGRKYQGLDLVPNPLNKKQECQTFDRNFRTRAFTNRV